MKACSHTGALWIGLKTPALNKLQYNHLLQRMKQHDNKNAYSIVASLTTITSGVVSGLVALRKLPRKLNQYHVETQPYSCIPCLLQNRKLLQKRWKTHTLHKNKSWWLNNHVAGVFIQTPKEAEVKHLLDSNPTQWSLAALSFYNKSVSSHIIVHFYCKLLLNV